MAVLLIACASPQSKFEGVEGGVVSGGVYKNPALGLSFHTPAGLVSVTFDALHAINEERARRATETILAPETVEATGWLHPPAVKSVFYASKAGKWDGRRTNVPSVEMNVFTARSGGLTFDKFKAETRDLATQSGQKWLGEPSQTTLGGHAFFRTDLAGAGDSHAAYESEWFTPIGEWEFWIDIYAQSPEELQRIAGFLESIQIGLPKR